jgi:H+/Cl- antiporter ClcA
LANSVKSLFTFLLIGIALSIFVIVANDRTIIIDKFVTEWGLSGVWELAFFIYILFFACGIFYAMMNESHSYFTIEDWVETAVVILFTIVGLIILNTLEFGSIDVAITAMQTETVNWSMFFGALLVVYIVNKLIVKR